MSSFLKNKAFCVLPFIEKFQNLNGNQYLCCYSSVPLTDNKIELAEKIYNGEQIPHCKNCYKLDTLKVVSPRLLESSRWLKIPEVNSYITNWSPIADQQTFFYDLRFDNKCNLACISCSPGSSSLLAKELNVTIPKYKLNFDINDCLTAKKIYIAGGEPLIINEFIELILKIAELEQQPELVINTNLTKILPLESVLKRIKNLTLTVSVDSFGSVNEYHRWPLKWDKFLNNLTWVRKNLNCTVQLNSVVDAVTIINIAKLIDIEHLVDQWTLSILTWPAALLLNNLPEIEKEKIIERFGNIKQSKFYTTDINFSAKVNLIVSQIKQPGDSYLLSNFIKQIDQRRNIDHTTYLGINLI
jgi:hypothetical protein